MHVPAYTRELIDLRRAGLAPDPYVVVTNCWRLAKAVRAGECCALVVRDREEPDLRSCFGLSVVVALPQLSRIASSSNTAPRGLAGVTLEEYLQILGMCTRAPEHELEALEALVRPIANACKAARVGSARLVDYERCLLIWQISARQVSARVARARA